jgi:type IV secretory pathway VirB10-like protein
VKHSLRQRAVLNSTLMRRLCGFVLFGIFAFAEMSCKKKAVAIPLPATPAQVSTPATPPPDPQPIPPEEPPKTPQPVVVKPPVRPAPQQPSPVVVQPPPVSPPPPVLGDVLPPEQQRRFNNAIDQNLASAQSILGSLSGKQLNQEQQRTVAQIQNFVQQANTRRRSDLAAAKSLAERAAVLARDLMKQFR